MSTENAEASEPGTATQAVFRRALHADRVARPQSCGCGLPVAFDVERKEFFCIGCGAGQACSCRRSAWSATVRHVNVN